MPAPCSFGDHQDQAADESPVVHRGEVQFTDDVGEQLIEVALTADASTRLRSIRLPDE
jgi:hypothetical protein